MNAAPDFAKEKNFKFFSKPTIVPATDTKNPFWIPASAGMTISGFIITILLTCLIIRPLHAAPDLTVSTCDDISQWSGGTLSTTELKQGTGSIRWEHGSNSRLELKNFPVDFSRHKSLSLWMHSNISNDQNFVLIIGSQNDTTDGIDYYSSEFTMDFTGWKQYTIDLKKFGTSRIPLGWDQINEFYFTASGWGNEPNSENIVHIDNILLTGDPPKPRDVLGNLRSEHPRLLIGEGGWPAVKTKMNKYQKTRDIFASIVRKADNILDDPVSTFEIPDGKRLLATSRRVLDRVYTLAYTYRMTEDIRYLNRAYAELAAAAVFPNWNPSHFLDVGEMTHAFAIGYDWLYGAWTPAQREVIRQAILKHGLNTYLTEHGKSAWWLSSEYNWNTVTNGGIGMGALALAVTDSLLAADIVNKTLISMESAGSIAMFGPDGAWAESPGYWTYATRYLFTYAASLESALGSSFGIMEVTGISETGGFPIYMTGPSGRLFNYADGGDGSIRAPWLYWLGDKFNNPLYNWFQSESSSSHPMDIIWYEDIGSSPEQLDLPLDKYYRKVEVATFRSSWVDPNALFAGFKAGDNDVGHSHLDLGEFILDAHEERWVHDLAAEDYNIGNYFSSNGWDAPRWTYYRCRAEANNTLVINPDNIADQDPKADTRFIRFGSKNDGEGAAVADITDAYNEMGASRVWRGIALFNNRTQILLQDEITTASPADVWWFMHTDAAAEIAADKKSAVMTLNKKRLSVKILDPGRGTMQMMPAIPLPASPNPAGQRENGNKLAIHITNVTDLTLPVLFTPLNTGDEPADVVVPQSRPLSDTTWPTGKVLGTKKFRGNNNNLITIEPERNMYRISSDKLIQFTIKPSNLHGTFSISEISGRNLCQKILSPTNNKIIWELNSNSPNVKPGVYFYHLIPKSSTLLPVRGKLIFLP